MDMITEFCFSVIALEQWFFFILCPPLIFLLQKIFFDVFKRFYQNIISNFICLVMWVSVQPNTEYVMFKL